MKLASYVANGKACFGAVTADGVITLNDRPGTRFAGLREALAAGALAQMRTAAETGRPDHGFGDIRWLPVIPDPEKFSAPASIIAPMPPRAAASCPSS
jgi:hypothetical protein